MCLSRGAGGGGAGLYSLWSAHCPVWVTHSTPRNPPTSPAPTSLLQAAELKFNCFFLMPLVDTFPSRMRRQLEVAYEQVGVSGVAALHGAGHAPHVPPPPHPTPPMPCTSSRPALDNCIMMASAPLC